ncbi:MAG: hypothetical protein CM1200mP4_3690 [Rhodospirillaceae bacterium]|nr:MAG: hypothetical protein CM1200mP4_3690 [Rhodospirillaceae bacterium]
MSPLASGLRGLVTVYRLHIPYLPASCRFYPSCSKYALEALAEHGAILGMVYTIKRILDVNLGEAQVLTRARRDGSSQEIPTDEKNS